MTDADTCFGKARIAGSRMYLDHLLGCIEGGWSFDDILREYPHLSRNQLQAMMGFVRDLVASKRNKLMGDRSRAAPPATDEITDLDTGDMNA